MTAGLYKALVAFQAEIPVIPHSRKVDAGKMKYSYAELQAIINIVRPVLAKHKLGFVQMIGADGLVTRLCHESGEHIEGVMPMAINGMPPQAAGSVITYYRRYALTAMLGIATDDDDYGAGGDKKLNGTAEGKSAPGKMPEAEFAEWTAKLKAAKTMPELQATFKDVASAAQTYGDAEAHALLKASAASIGATLKAAVA